MSQRRSVATLCVAAALLLICSSTAAACFSGPKPDKTYFRTASLVVASANYTDSELIPLLAAEDDKDSDAVNRSFEFQLPTEELVEAYRNVTTKHNVSLLGVYVFSREEAENAGANRTSSSMCPLSPASHEKRDVMIPFGLTEELEGDHDTCRVFKFGDKHPRGPHHHGPHGPHHHGPHGRHHRGPQKRVEERDVSKISTEDFGMVGGHFVRKTRKASAEVAVEPVHGHFAQQKTKVEVENDAVSHIQLREVNMKPVRQQAEEKIDLAPLVDPVPSLHLMEKKHRRQHRRPHHEGGHFEVIRLLVDESIQAFKLNQNSSTIVIPVLRTSDAKKDGARVVEAWATKPHEHHEPAENSTHQEPHPHPHGHKRHHPEGLVRVRSLTGGDLIPSADCADDMQMDMFPEVDGALFCLGILSFLLVFSLSLASALLVRAHMTPAKQDNKENDEVKKLEA